MLRYSALKASRRLRKPRRIRTDPTIRESNVKAARCQWDPRRGHGRRVGGFVAACEGSSAPIEAETYRLPIVRSDANRRGSSAPTEAET